MLLAQEWNQIFFVRDLALRTPETLIALETTRELDLGDVGAIIVFSFFSIGWILFCISIIVAKVYRPIGSVLIIIGFFAAPILGAILPSMWGLILGSAVLSCGWFLVGLERFKNI